MLDLHNMCTMPMLDTHICLTAPALNRQVECYTFGAPRVGNRQFAADVNRHVTEAFSVVNDTDAVRFYSPEI